MRYLLDTNIVSLFARGQDKVKALLIACAPSELAISAITQMEISYGFRLNPTRVQKVQPVIERLLGPVTVLPFERADGEMAGQIRADLQAMGQPVGPFDLLIASCAVRRGLCLVTNNTREFQRIKGLVLEDWSHSTTPP